jgi:hypothetical protein
LSATQLELLKGRHPLWIVNAHGWGWTCATGLAACGPARLINGTRYDLTVGPRTFAVTGRPIHGDRPAGSVEGAHTDDAEC